MVIKILRGKLWLLFILAFINAVYFFFNQSFPDNSLAISSDSSSVSYISYGISSLFSLVSYYVGPWVIAPFVCLLLSYVSVLKNREKEFDLFIPFLLVGFFFSITFMFFPEFMGKGLVYASEQHLNTYITFGMALLFGFFVALITMRGAFWENLQLFHNWLGRLGVNSLKMIRAVYLSAARAFKQASNTLNLSRLKLKAIKLVKHGAEKRQALSAPKTANTVNTANSPSVSPSRKAKISTPAANKELDAFQVDPAEDNGAEVIEKNVEKKVEIEDVSDSQSSNVAVEKAAPNVREPRNKEAEDTFFESNELINCISENTTRTRIQGPDEDYFNTICATIESKLQEFNVTGQIIHILKGPVVDTYELELGAGIKASKVKGLEDDIGLALDGAPVRVVYPLAGRSTIGIEVPRNPREFIYLDEVLQSPIFNESNKRLPIAIGKDAFGEVSVMDLAGMPHMLVAGATGAGKSVFINTMLVSLIIKKSPKELKLVLIDPKQLELALFSTLPHLMLPVITEARSAAVALLWAVEEMERRYTILKEMGVKNIEGFNKKLKQAGPSVLWKISQYYKDGDENGYELPYIVIVIDEFADLILTKSGKDIETNVNRLAAKARAAGIHLVLATQRPSTDVITGVIKANFPTRVAFRVTTGHDSKTILDQHGAQKLLGKGDMLYKHGVDMLRLHGSYVDETEIEVLVEKLSELPSDFDTSAMEFLENGGEEEATESTEAGAFVSGTSEDPVYQEALQVIMERGEASASMLQRRLRVGYNRAANLIDELERNGVVGPAQGSKPRKVLPRPE